MTAPRLRISRPSDASELAADRVAERLLWNGADGMSLGSPGARIHTGEGAAAAAEALNARAFTVGRDIVFGRNEYQPGTMEGRRLLAHEMAHVAQQRETHAAQPLIQRSIRLTNPLAEVPHAPGEMGPFDSRQNTLQGWLRTLCPDGNWSVNAAGDVTSVDRATFCGASPTAGHAHRTTTAHRTSCGCLCELTGPGSRTIEVQIDDNLTIGASVFPLAPLGEAGTAHLGPTSKVSGFTGRSHSGLTGAGATTPIAGAGRSQTIPDPPWVIFGHEVCGHARLQTGPMGPTQVEHSTTPAGDVTPVDVENRIRREHSTVASSLGIRRGVFSAKNAAGVMTAFSGSVYRARAADTLPIIAARCGIAAATDHIWRFNGDRITAASPAVAVGEDLLVEGIDWHEVISGETMASVAAMWSIPVASLRRANPQVTAPSYSIAAGDRLLIPAT